ncbi:sigma-70 family RNA polymerase sigma factor [Actinomadura oligospora]|uniref:sigma-70 family RNA polymerase sigma factor n=1 Tax=Actinomadura oligospora TaxID=111804 RepID=UPI000478E87F|nr:sigma-70 family RNA polymerase sigma factor [Actinomadura oligospora]
MSGWPTLDHQDDERLARSLARSGAHVLSGPPPGDATAPFQAADTDALARLVDAYAARLFDYCHALLRDQDQAARALHAALLAAYAHASGLTDPASFRAWLYALVRNECLRRLRDPQRPAERHEAPEVEDVFLDEAERTRRLATRRLVHAALGDLRGPERESLDLLLRHGLETAEVAAVLDLSAPRAAELTRRARGRLDDALAVAVIARTGRDDCPEVAALAGDGADETPLPPAVVRRLIRHIDACPVCRERRGRTVSTARLLQVLPVALMPADLRPAVLSAASDPARFDRLLAAAKRAEPFDEDGWPLSLDGSGSGSGSGGDDEPRRSSPRFWPALAVAAAVLLIVAVGFFLMPGSSTNTSANGTPRPSGSSAPDASDPPSSSSGPTETPSPTKSASPSPTTSSASPSPRSPSPSRHSPRPAPTRPTTPSGPTHTAPAGRLAVSPGSCALSAQNTSCGITVVAVGGPVTWSVGARSPLVAQGGGTLRSGGTGHATITLAACDESGSGTVSFSPGGGVAVSWTCP